MTSPDDEFTLLEERLDPDERRLDPEIRDIEAPPADAAEQATPANPRDIPLAPRTAFEADEYDAIEQSRIVELDDDY